MCLYQLANDGEADEMIGWLAFVSAPILPI